MKSENLGKSRTLAKVLVLHADEVTDGKVGKNWG